MYKGYAIPGCPDPEDFRIEISPFVPNSWGQIFFTISDELTTVTYGSESRRSTTGTGNFVPFYIRDNQSLDIYSYGCGVIVTDDVCYEIKPVNWQIGEPVLKIRLNSSALNGGIGNLTIIYNPNTKAFTIPTSTQGNTSTYAINPSNCRICGPEIYYGSSVNTPNSTNFNVRYTESESIIVTVPDLTVDPSSKVTFDADPLNGYVLLDEGFYSEPNDAYFLAQCKDGCGPGLPYAGVAHVVNACGSYTWLENGLTYTASGLYANTVSVSSGIDTLGLIQLNINQGTISTLNEVSCDSYTWSTNGVTYTTSGVYHFLTSNEFGCANDEILNLIINPLPIVTATNVSACFGSPVMLNGSPAGGSWDLPNPYSGSATSYSYYYTDGNGCTGSATAAISNPPVITNISVINITGISATVKYDATPGAAWNELRWRPVGAATWTVGTNGTALTKVLVNLTPNTVYEVQARVLCSLTSTPPWPMTSTLFTTTNICGIPSDLIATNISGTTATISWTTTMANFYTIRYRKIGTSVWTTGTSASTSKVIAGLSLASNYEFQVKSNCGSSSSAFSSSSYFTTANMKSSQQAIPVEDKIDQLVIYPNPAHEEITLNFYSRDITQFTLQLSDMSGRIMKIMTIDVTEGDNETTMDLRNITSGVYTLQVINNNKVIQVERVVKE